MMRPPSQKNTSNIVQICGYFPERHSPQFVAIVQPVELVELVELVERFLTARPAMKKHSGLCVFFLYALCLKMLHMLRTLYSSVNIKPAEC